MSKGVKKKGFTLVELVVVLAIFGLLASITGMGLYSWTRYSINKENNENARTIFLAAQESLTHMQASGTLSDLNMQITTSEAETDKIFETPLNKIDPIDRDYYADRLYTVFYNSDDPNRTDSILYKILETSLQGTDVLNGTIAMEFDPYDATVYSVFYSNKADSFSYNQNGINETGAVGIARRDTGTLKDRLVGYYAVELSARKPDKLPAVLEKNTSQTETGYLINGNELYVRIPTEELKDSDFDQYEFTINIYSPDTKNHQTTPLVYFKIKGSELKSLSGRKVLSYEAYYTRNGNNNFADKQINLATERDAKNIRIYLDSIDVKTVSILRSNNSLKINKNNYIEGYKNLFTNTLSIFDLFDLVECEGSGSGNENNGALDFHFIQCDFQVKKGNQIVMAIEKTSQPVSYLYDNITKNGSNFVVSISNMRHLFNICYLEEMIKNSEHTISATYNQISTFSFDNSFVYNSDNSTDFYKNMCKSFPVLEALSNNSKINGNGYVIKEFVLNSDILENSQHKLGLFETNNGIINGLSFEKATLISKKENISGEPNDDVGSGIISAINYGNILNSKVSGSIEGYKNIGGIVGVNKKNINGCESFVLISTPNNETSTPNNNAYNLGGIAGYNKGADDNNNVTIQNCKYTAANSLSLTDLEKENFFDDKLYGTNIGGIAGNSYNAKIIDCVTSFNNEGYISGYKNVGGLIGSMSGRNSSITSTSGFIVNEINIIGTNNIGGVIGYVSDINSVSNLENRGIVILHKTGDESSEFAGGITSYLDSNITMNNCYSNVSKDTDGIREKALKNFSNGDYVGGLTGYQNGKITSDKEIKHKVLVAGDKYVGGLCGEISANWNYLENQIISSGYIFGESYVGGLAGKNNNGFSDNYLKPQTINEVIGKGEFVGGLFGYCVDQVGSNDQIMHYIDYVKGTKHVGGIVGYTASSIKNQHVTSSIFGNEDYIGGICGEALGQIYSENINIISDVSVKGRDYVGGISGLSNDDVQNMRVKGEIEGNDHVGGISGHAKKGIYNSDSAYCMVNVSGYSYVGGIAGESNGRINNVFVKGLDDNSNARIIGKGNYIGGIVGYTEADIYSGSTSQCSMVDVSGASYVGGIAGASFGDQISYQYISSASDKNASIVGTGDYVGGIAGYTEASIYSGSISQCNNVDVQGASFVGGIAGKSVAEQISNQYVSGLNGKNSTIIGTYNYVGGCVGENSSNIYGNNLTFNVTVEGNNNVGGLIGAQYSNKQINGYISNSSIVKGNINVGGYIGEYSATGEFTSSLNSSVKLVEGNSYVGGLIGFIKADGKLADKYSIKDSEVSGRYSSSVSSYIGGLFGKLDCNNCIIKADIENLKVTGTNYVGGITSILENGCTIDNTVIKNLIINHVSNDGFNVNPNEHMSGGVVSLNEGIIKNVKLTSSIINGSNITGGIAARNAGTISQCNLESNIINLNISSDTAGLLAGINEKVIEKSISLNNKIMYDGNEILAGGSLSNQGDIVGINGSNKVLDNEKMAIISECRSVHKIEEGSTLNHSIAGTNLASIDKTVNLSDSNGEIINKYINNINISNRDISISRPVRNGNGFTFAFSDTQSNNNNYVVTIFGLLIGENRNISQTLLERHDCDANQERFSVDNIGTYDGFRIVLFHNSTGQELSSVFERCYFFDVELEAIVPSYSFDETNRAFKINWNINNFESDYISGFELGLIIADNVTSLENEILYTSDNKTTEKEVQVTSVMQDKNGNSFNVKNGDTVKFYVKSINIDNCEFYTNSIVKYTEPFTLVDSNIVSIINLNSGENEENILPVNSEESEGQNDEQLS